MTRRRAGRSTPALPPSKLTLRDAIDEAVSGVTSRTGRSVATALGTVLGVAAFVASLGITATASAQISSRFDVLRATEVNVRDLGESRLGEETFPADTDDRLRRLAGVRSAGLLYVARDNARVEASRVQSLDQTADAGLKVVAATPGGLGATRPRLAAGRLFDDYHTRAAAAVAVLGASAARRLDLTRVDNQPVIFVEGVPVSVIGIVDDVAQETAVIDAVVLPESTARRLFALRSYKAAVLVDVEPGGAGQVGEQVAVALRPHDPERLQVVAPPDPDELRRGVGQETSSLFLALALLALVVGGVSIVNTTLVAVVERIPEIGLRRALGARPRHVAAHVLTEAAVLGTHGGVVGASAGVLVTAAVAAVNTWAAVLDTRLVLVAPLIGTFTGLVAGLHPASRAIRIPPVAALRR